ncbi:MULTISPECIES: GPW/gp25 family protein [unclassified Caballeronia]|uniref:GPW/gp25 family protein n=1 Tax=unclassified Caballeronia TaxID=2646786 RepID=UPI0028671E41|nr:MULTISPECIES: GPW/gp25 family protein [unclassified Caballeronia]MDR5816427.1 GPW/gp25 family protein [Caballeronia sp. LZ033]MDR5823096.1 GPW/gp25 family protein [Caballeronia sp. LZ043]MDR5881225.1 GPW/gp25 family protein [Caballeronia sp. LZ032]
MIDDSVLTSIYGRGWAFPPAFSLEEGVVMSEGVEDVRQSLRILFATEPGERIMREEYGCALYDVMFRNIDSELTSEIERRVADAVLSYEPRANLTDILVVQAESNRSAVEVGVTYRLRGSEIDETMSGTLDLNQAMRGDFL